MKWESCTRHILSLLFVYPFCGSSSIYFFIFTRINVHFPLLPNQLFLHTFCHFRDTSVISGEKHWSHWLSFTPLSLVAPCSPFLFPLRSCSHLSKGAPLSPEAGWPMATSPRFIPHAVVWQTFSNLFLYINAFKIFLGYYNHTFSL